MSNATEGKLGIRLAIMLVAGSMMGSGVYLLPASLAAFGSVSILAWLATIVVALGLAMMFAHLVAGQRDGDPAGFIGAIERALGKPAAMTAAGLYWLQGILGNVALALAVTGYASVLLPPLAFPAMTLATPIMIVWILTGLALSGPRLVARIEEWTLAIGLLPVLAAGTIGWLLFDPAVFIASWNVTGRSLAEVLPPAMLTILWAYLGLESASLAARFVRDPQRTIPIATIGGVLLASVVYVSACTVVAGIIPAAELARSSAPFADIAKHIGGVTVAVIVATCAALRAGGTLAGWILLTGESGRLVFTMAGAGPRAGSYSRHLTGNALLVTAGLTAAASQPLIDAFTTVINLTVVVMLLVYAIAIAAWAKALRFRKRR